MCLSSSPFSLMKRTLQIFFSFLSNVIVLLRYTFYDILLEVFVNMNTFHRKFFGCNCWIVFVDILWYIHFRFFLFWFHFLRERKSKVLFFYGIDMLLCNPFYYLNTFWNEPDLKPWRRLSCEYKDQMLFDISPYTFHRWWSLYWPRNRKPLLA